MSATDRLAAMDPDLTDCIAKFDRASRVLCANTHAQRVLAAFGESAMHLGVEGFKTQMQFSFEERVATLAALEPITEQILLQGHTSPMPLWINDAIYLHFATWRKDRQDYGRD